MLFRFSNRGSELTKARVSVSLKFFKELQEHGADDLLQREYGPLLVKPPEDDFNVTLSVDLKALATAEDSEVTIKKIALLKRNCFASVFEKYFEFQELKHDQKENDSGNQTEEMQKKAVIHYREDETMYVEAKADRVTVIFSTVFKDITDMIIGKVYIHPVYYVFDRHLFYVPLLLFK